VLPATVEPVATNRPSKVFATGAIVAVEVSVFAVIEPVTSAIVGWARV